jgi:hypothetical protein
VTLWADLTLQQQETNRTGARTRHQRDRLLVIEHYVGRCACCGESEPVFLHVDHKSGGGNEHRREIGGSARIVRWLIKNGYPDGFQLLCANCNMAIGILGQCPHQSGLLTRLPPG